MSVVSAIKWGPEMAYYSNVLNPAEVGWFAPISRQGSPHSPITSALWGPAGDPPWPMANRRKKLARHLRTLRTADQRALARLVRDYAHRPDCGNLKASAIREAHRIGVDLFERGFSTGERLSLHQMLVAAGRAEYQCGAEGTYRLVEDGTCRNDKGVLYGASANPQKCIGMTPAETAAEMRRYYCIP